MALSSETGQIYVFDLESNSLIATYTSHAMAVRSLAWSPDSSVSRSFVNPGAESLPMHIISSSYLHPKINVSPYTTCDLPLPLANLVEQLQLSRGILHGSSARTCHPMDVWHSLGLFDPIPFPLSYTNEEIDIDPPIKQ